MIAKLNVSGKDINLSYKVGEKFPTSSIHAEKEVYDIAKLGSLTGQWPSTKDHYQRPALFKNRGRLNKH